MTDPNVNQQEGKKIEEKPKTAPATKLSKPEISVLQYFSNLPVNRQRKMMDEHNIDFAKFMEAVLAHRNTALTDDELAVEKMLAEQAPKKSGEKLSLLANRYRASIERFAKRGVTPVMIASHLTEVERKNYPKRTKAWKFTSAMVANFMKDNEIEVIKKGQ